MLKAFAVLDLKAGAFGMPMFVSTAGLAMRGFTDAMKDSRSPMAQHPEDYVLYEIGSYDPNSGQLESLPKPVHLLSAAHVAAQMVASEQAPRQLGLPGAKGSIPRDLKEMADRLIVNDVDKSSPSVKPPVGSVDKSAEA